MTNPHHPDHDRHRRPDRHRPHLRLVITPGIEPFKSPWPSPAVPARRRTNRKRRLSRRLEEAPGLPRAAAHHGPGDETGYSLRRLPALGPLASPRPRGRRRHVPGTLAPRRCLLCTTSPLAFDHATITDGIERVCSRSDTLWPPPSATEDYDHPAAHHLRRPSGDRPSTLAIPPESNEKQPPFIEPTGGTVREEQDAWPLPPRPRRRRNGLRPRPPPAPTPTPTPASSMKAQARGYARISPASRRTMNFHSLYDQGFARVAAVTLPVRPRAPSRTRARS